MPLLKMNLNQLLRRLFAVPALLLIGLARVYQWIISPILGPHCRFQPTCSEYFILAVKKYGVFRGVLRGLWRICRCHPWSQGGPDWP